MRDKRVLIAGLGGVTCGGKSTIARKLFDEFSKSLHPQKCQKSLEILIINQDDYYKNDKEMIPLPEFNYHHWDHPSAIDYSKILKIIDEKINKIPIDKKLLIIVEGNLIFLDENLAKMFHKRYFFTTTYEKCKAIRDNRTYDPPDPPGYFDKIAWPTFLEYEKEMILKLKCDTNYAELLNSDCLHENFTKISIFVRKWAFRDWLLLTFDHLSIDQAKVFVTEPQNGAIACFLGMTRDNFKGKQVVSLEYECYESMAYEKMHEICINMREKFKSVDKIAIFHRLGNVPISETSVIIAVSAAHRKEAFMGCEYAIDEIKRIVPIWKKELYSDGTSSWKES